VQTDLQAVQAIGARIAVVVGARTVLRTVDGGASWSRDYSGPQSLHQVDFIDPDHGWAVGDTSLLRTVDGATWAAASEPIGAVLTEVHFVSVLVGYGLSGRSGGAPPSLFSTVDGGLHWRSLRSPVAPVAVTANSRQDLWLAGSDSLWRSRDGGATWKRRLAAVPAPSGSFAGSGYGARLQAAGAGNVWAEFDVGQGAASQRPWLLYGGGDGDQFECLAAFTGSCPQARADGSYPATVSAVSTTRAVLVENCPACSSPHGVVSVNLGGATQRLGQVAVYGPLSLSFGSPSTGYLLAQFRIDPIVPGSGQVIEITRDGGRTWITASFGTPAPHA